jgi:hypothetical protein
MFDLISDSCIQRMEVSGYFGQCYLDNNMFYIADANGLTCIDRKGKISWRQNNLGIDGVIIETISNNLIFGKGEWDPPNGWRDFKLNKLTEM